MTDTAAFDAVHLAVAITQAGYTLRFVPYCEDADTPGLLGQIRGKVDRANRVVTISTKANPTEAMIAEILAHEYHHITDPTWDCGSRDVFGRGGPQ